MNNNQISNPKTEVPTGIKMNDKDYITCLLTILKDMVKNYTIAMTEASCKSLYQQHLEAFLRIADLQRETYELMFQMGWYILEKADQKKIQDKYSSLNQEFTDLKS